MASFAEGSEHDSGGRYAIVKAVDREVERQANQHARVAEAVATRAALLVSAALIFISFPREEDAEQVSCFYAVALICALIGATCGVWALFFKRKGEEVSLDRLEAEIWNLDEIQALRAITAAKRSSLQQDRKRLKTRHRITIIGFTFLLFSVGAIALHLLFGI